MEMIMMIMGNNNDPGLLCILPDRIPLLRFSLKLDPMRRQLEPHGRKIDTGIDENAQATYRNISGHASGTKAFKG